MLKIFSFIFLISMMVSSSINTNTKTYSVKKIAGKDFQISGKGDNVIWRTANVLNDFTYPWEKEAPPATSFKALHSDQWVYLLYEVKDENINVYVNTNEKTEVMYSDRVEIFFRKDSEMLPYYGLELDPHGRVYDYEVFYHRKFNRDWSWPSGQLQVKSNIKKGGYSVEVAISKESLVQMGLLKNNQLEAGIFRGECIEIKKASDSDIKWISWVIPDSPTPDFHIPSAFGILSLE